MFSFRYNLLDLIVIVTADDNTDHIVLNVCAFISFLIVQKRLCPQENFNVQRSMNDGNDDGVMTICCVCYRSSIVISNQTIYIKPVLSCFTVKISKFMEIPLVQWAHNKSF